MARDTFINGTETPNGKRTVRRNAYGSMWGYIGRTRWEAINVSGISEYSEEETIAAQAWINGREDWMDAPWMD
jgi:hypothetical protein